MQDSRDSKSMRKCNNHAKHIVTTPDLQVGTGGFEGWCDRCGKAGEEGRERRRRARGK